jgi:hypothetical protein
MSRDISPCLAQHSHSIHCVALLDSKELDGKNLPGLESIGFSETVDPGALKVVGHPYGIDLMPTNGLLLRSQKLVDLRSLLTSGSSDSIQVRGSPHYRAMVLSIQGKLLPGDSGAPILDSQNRVLAIANGGLKGGLADISWAVPMNKLSWENNPGRTLARLRELKPDAVFFFASEEPPTLLDNFDHDFATLLYHSMNSFEDYKGHALPLYPPHWEGTFLGAGAKRAEVTRENGWDEDEKHVIWTYRRDTYCWWLGEGLSSDSARKLYDQVWKRLKSLCSDWENGTERIYKQRRITEWIKRRDLHGFITYGPSDTAPFLGYFVTLEVERMA